MAADLTALLERLLAAAGDRVATRPRDVAVSGPDNGNAAW